MDKISEVELEFKAEVDYNDNLHGVYKDDSLFIYIINNNNKLLKIIR